MIFGISRRWLNFALIFLCFYVSFVTLAATFYPLGEKEDPDSPSYQYFLRDEKDYLSDSRSRPEFFPLFLWVTKSLPLTSPSVFLLVTYALRAITITIFGVLI